MNVGKRKGCDVPKQPTKGTRQFNVELPTELVDEFRQFCEARGEPVSNHTARAMRRHLDNPPPLPPADPPLPNVPPEPAATKPKRGREKA